MKYSLHRYISCIASTLLFASTLQASDNNRSIDNKAFVLPYAFNSDATGFTIGLGWVKQGLFQPQTTFAISYMMATPKDIINNQQVSKAAFKGTFLTFTNYHLPYSKRLFFSLTGFKSYFPQQRYYFNGSHQSKYTDGINTSGDSNFLYASFEYILPIGEGLHNPEALYQLKNGFALHREQYGNGIPFVTGRTSLGIKTFYQEESFENWQAFTLWQDKSLAQTPQWDTNGLRFFLTHDNTDFHLNPSRGYHFELQYSKDFGRGDSLQSWDFLEFKCNKYYTLDTFSFTQQNVLALSLWTGYSFSWDNHNEIVPGINANRPPTWEGARLGGYNRLRGYENNRFSDKAVFYATAEYRATLQYNPFKHYQLTANVDWLQLVAFVEAGRVNDTYNFDLLTDLKYDVGVSLRAMVAQLPVRFDVAYGDEGVNMWVMIHHPFDF